MPEWGATLIAALIAAAGVFVIAGLGAAVAWGRIKQTLANYAEKFAAVSSEVGGIEKKLSKDIEAVKRGIYKDDGTLVYVPAIECEKRRAACDKIHAGSMRAVCDKIDELKGALQVSEGKREEDAKSINTRLGKIEVVVGALAAVKEKGEAQ